MTSIRCHCVHDLARCLSAGALLGVALGCSSASDYYEDAVQTVRQRELPDADEANEAIDDLNEAIVRAERELSENAEQSSPSHHDQTAYLIPLAHLAKAELHARYDQTTLEEDACWSAIRDAERFLGGHLASGTARPPELLFASYSVFFRREKVRRHAFTLLAEAYRRAGERDLEELMRVQVGLSDIYLRSPVAHGEEEQIRILENADWVRRYQDGKADVANGLATTLLVVATIGTLAAIGTQQDELEQMSAQTSDPAVQADLQARMRQLNEQRELTTRQFGEASEELRKQHEATRREIQQRYESTFAGALMANFELLRLSDEVKQLEAFQELNRRKEYFDNYVLRFGFDEQAARALTDMRTHLDQLTAELQARRRGQAAEGRS